MKTVMITGASSGLGAAMAMELAQGYDLVLMGRDSKRLQGVCQRARGLREGSSMESMVCDLSSRQEIEGLVKNFGERKLDVLVNNAGVVSKQNFEQTSDKEWTRQWEVNMMGPVRLTRLLFPCLKKASAPLVINISSTAALRPVPGLSAYSTVKAAMVMWTKSLAQEWGKYKIRVNCICPGIVNTPIQNFHGLPEDQLQEFHQLHPLGRMGRPEDIAQMVSYLIKAGWVTGSVMTVDGGITLR